MMMKKLTPEQARAILAAFRWFVCDDWGLLKGLAMVEEFEELLGKCTATTDEAEFCEDEWWLPKKEGE